MALRDHDTRNFDTLFEAISNGAVALVESRVVETGEYIALVCAMSQNDDGTITPVPFATMVKGNPFELFMDPTMDELPEPTDPQPDKRRFAVRKQEVGYGIFNTHTNEVVASYFTDREVAEQRALKMEEEEQS